MNTGATFSANSLKILDKDPALYKLKYEDGLFLNPDNRQAKAGQNLHEFLRFYLQDFDIKKIENSFGVKDLAFLESIKEYDAIKTLKNASKSTDSEIQKYIEQPFFVKCLPNETSAKQEFYLTGRFDAVLKSKKGIEIYDWKMVNVPENAEFDIQTIVYLYSAFKLYKTENISITYVSLTKNESKTIYFDPKFNYIEKISKIVSKNKSA